MVIRKKKNNYVPLRNDIIIISRYSKYAYQRTHIIVAT